MEKYLQNICSLKILEVLKNEGFITNFYIESLENNKKALALDFN